MEVHSVYATNIETGEEIHYLSVNEAATALGADPSHVRRSCRLGGKCFGFYCRYGEVIEVPNPRSRKESKKAKMKDYKKPEGKRAVPRPNICFDCKNACGGCSWSEINPITCKPRFEPVPGWTAEKVMLNVGGMLTETYHITECPLFERDNPRKDHGCELTYTESCDFLTNIRYMLKRWDRG